MDGLHYAELMAFMAISEARSFRDAALRLGVTPSALSRTLRRLEARMGVRLLNRTTRSVSPTEAGAVLYANLAPAVAGVEQAVQEVSALRDDAAGTVRLNLPRLAAEMVLLPRLARFHARHPRIRLEMVIDDALSDVVAKGFDAGIRIGERLAQDVIAVRVTSPIRVAVVGSPAYFAAHEPPESPQDVRQHACINYRWEETGQVFRWLFRSAEQTLEIDVDGPIVVNDTGLIRDAAVAGLGLAYLPQAAVQAHVDRGMLVRVLDPWCMPQPGFYLYHPSRHQTPPALRALIAFLQEEGAP